MRFAALLLLAAAFPSDRYLEDIRTAIDRTAADGYAYGVEGRFERHGVYASGDVLTSTIRTYRSIRHGEKILVKGPEGLWRTPEERLGEKVENPDPDAPRIIRTLESARSPHVMLRLLLQYVTKGRRPVDRDVDGVRVRRYTLSFTRESLRKSLEEQMEKALKAGQLDRPDRTRWSTARGDLLVYVSRGEGRLFRVIDRRTVKLIYEKPDERPVVKTYRLEMTYRYSKWGGANPEVPPEVRERLEIPRK